MTRASPIRSRAGQRWLDQLQRRIHEPAFWWVQAGIVVVTALHVALDRVTTDPDQTDLAFNLAHLTVILYVAPVAYAGLVYGFEGAVLTGLWSSALVTPALVVWHRDAYAWVGEEARVAVVVGTGIVLAIPVERERRERQRVEATARRFELLNRVATAATDTRDVARMVAAVLRRLRTELAPRSACVWVGDHDNEPVVLVCDGGHDHPWDRHGPDPPADGAVITPLTIGAVAGELIVFPAEDRPLTPEDVELLNAVGAHLGVAIENAMLHKQERDSLESYVRLVTRAHEDERAHIARELHDGATQELALLCRRLDNLAVGVGAPSGETSDALELLRRQAEATLVSLRQFARDLRPALLDDFGLVPAIEWLISDLTGRVDLRSNFEVNGPPRRLAPEKEVALFRIVQEALRNIERHAEASTVTVDASFCDTRVAVSVRDDGHGFTVPNAPSHLVPSGRLGLMGMRERAQLVGGTLAIESMPGRGTCLTVSVPT